MEAAGAGGSSSLVFRGCELPPGFRFQPTDQEIILCYLKKKIAGAAAGVTSIIADVDIYKFDPWELPGKAVFGEGEWFFFSPRDRKYPNGARPNRTAGSGYWKATGTDKPILELGHGARCLGVKKALVFYQGRSPKGTKTQWVMHEYRLLPAVADTTPTMASRSSSMRLDDWVLCRVRNKDYYTCSLSSSSSSDQPAAANIMRSVRDQDEVAAVPDHAGIDYWRRNSEPPAVVAQQQSAGGEDDDEHGNAQLVSVLESIKRNLSFQAIDELFLLQQRPTKRPNYSCIMPREGNDHHITSSFFSISEADDDDLFF